MFKDAYSKWTTLFFVVMAAFAVVFAKERFQADGAHYLLHIVQSENFRIEHQRYILAFSQFLPIVGAKLGASLNVIFVLNSLNPVLWFLGLFLYAVRFLKDRKAGIAVILTSVLGVLHIQFIPMYEIYYGIPLVILLYAHILNNRYGSLLEMVLFIALMFTALFAHPLLPIPIVFALVYSSIEKRKLDFKLIGVSTVVILIWYALKKLMLTEYEAGKMSLVTADWNTAYKQLLQPEYYWRLLVFFFTWYTVPVLLVLWTAVFFLLRKYKLQLLVTLIFFTGHILIVNFTHENDPVLSPYFERMYLPLVPIALIPFVFTLCRELEFSRSFVIFSLLMVVGWRLVRFTDVGLDYSSRTKQTEELIMLAARSEGSKFVMHNTDFQTCFRWADWSFPMETLLRSSAINSGRNLTIATPEDLAEGDNSTALNANEFLFRRWEVMHDSQLNSAYFHLQEGLYVTLPAVCK